VKNLTLLLTLAFGVSAFAMTPPKLPANMPPLQKPPAVKLRPAAKVVAPNGIAPKQTPRPLDRETIESMAIDANVKRFLLEQLEGAGRMAPAGELPANDEFLSRRRPALKSDALRAVANTTILTPRQATNDATQEYEPAVIVNRFSNVDWTTTVFMKYDSNNVRSSTRTAPTARAPSPGRSGCRRITPGAAIRSFRRTRTFRPASRRSAPTAAASACRSTRTTPSRLR
jgi:hypothetical protein